MRMGCTFLLMLTGLMASGPLRAQEIARWDFEKKDAIRLTPHRKIQHNQPGPRPPEFPDLDAKNTAVRFTSDAYLSFPDPGAKSKFDFTNGDAITLEGWVNPDRLRNGELWYVIGKGRTASPKFARDNQNWALRIVGGQGEAHISFLFATKPSDSDKHWHRWTSKLGFWQSTGWHHVAVAYRFGDPKSIRGWVNGKPTAGTWDMGGPTKEPPVVDDDAIWIGNRFAGMLDAIAIHRTILDDKTIAGRFRRVGKPRVAKLQDESMPELGVIPDDRVLMQICAGLPTERRWLYESEKWPAESMRWLGNEFLLPRIPLQFDSWGIRTGWNAPLLLRMAADVDLPVGEHRFLMRARALGRLWIDGKIVTRTKAISRRPPDGEEPITPVPVPPIRGARARGYRQQETFGEFTITPDGKGKVRRCRVVLELVVGGNNHRTETGEVCVALLAQDGKSYDLLSAGSKRVPLTDAAVEPVLSHIEASLAKLDDQRRRTTSATQDAFWDKRHRLARDWATKHLSVPDNPSVDFFIQSKIERALTASSGADGQKAKHFHEQVLPILRENCFRCHGEKDRGGLKLNSREAILKGGESKKLAVVPGNVNASELMVRVRSKDDELRMPPNGKGLDAGQIKLLETWIKDGASWPDRPLTKAEVAFSPVISDEAFLRRVYLDTVGVPPTLAEAKAFLDHKRPDKRERLIRQLLEDERGADHWMSFWLDLLAENPSLLNASLNSTGPFRWFLYDSMRDNKPLDRMVTELLLMRGGAAEGGSAGFALAGENDAPYAAKGHILASAFLGVELQCARCHDSPYHSTTQRDLYSLAAMLQRKSVKVPATSRVPAAFFEKQKSRESLIQVTLKPGEPVRAQWPFAKTTGVVDDTAIDPLTHNPKDTRERLAALITAPQNQRFSRVIVNRIWKRLMGAGMVEPVHDWEGNSSSHPELLNWLAHELVANDYDLRHVVRLILSSQAYQRSAVGSNVNASPTMRFFRAPDRRRLTAEQIVDSLHHAVGRPIDVEELTFVHDGRRALGKRQTLGRPTRAWMFGDLKNERDRPSLSLPKARAVVDVLEAFGWTGARQMPIHERDSDPNVLQPGVLANGTLSITLTRASHGSELANVAVEAKSPTSLTDQLFLRILSRSPKPEERKVFASALAKDFGSRLVPTDQVTPPTEPKPLPQVTWFNHLRPRANEIQLELERRVQAGPPSDPRLQPAWREVYEDIVWSLINHREFVWMP